MAVNELPAVAGAEATPASRIKGTSVPQEPLPRTHAATEKVKLLADERAVDDPAKLARAARIVRTALERRALTIADVLPRERGDAA